MGFAGLLRMAVSRGVRRVVWRSGWGLAMRMGKGWEGFTLKWENWKAG